MISKEMDILKRKLAHKANNHSEEMVALVLMEISLAICETESEIVNNALKDDNHD